MLRIIDKNTLLFLRDDFDFNPETEIGLTCDPAEGLYQARAVQTFDENGVPVWHWEEAGTPPPDKRTYEQKLIALIRTKYSIDNEISLLNKGIANAQDVEYVAYRAFVAQCKEELKL